MFTERIQARAKVSIHQERAYAYDASTGLFLYKPVGEDEEVWNILTNAGRIQIHNFVYGTSSRTNGFNYLAVTNDSGAPAAGDTTLAGELTTNGLQRAQGIVSPPVGSGNVTTVAHLFTYTGLSAQGIQKAALFDSAVGGVMTHEIAFTPRSLVTNDTISITFSITLG